MDRKDEIRALLGGAAYSRLFAAVRQRIEEAGVDAARTVTLTGLDDGEREALAGLLGSARRPAPTFRLRLDRLDEALRATRANTGLAEVLEALGGPLADRKGERQSGRMAREDLWVRAASHPTVVARPSLGEWLNALKRTGLLSRLARMTGGEEARLLDGALEVLSRLPADGKALSVLAAEVAGDAHALDRGRALSTLVIRAIPHLLGRPSPPDTATDRRRLWEEMGVVCDPLSPHVLVLGMRPSGPGSLARYLREAAEAGEPVKLTLRQIGPSSLALPERTVVYICENPSVVAVAADRLGGRCPPLICTEGVPSTAAVRLLETLRAAGAPLRFHGDFDWGGVRIMNDLHARFGVAPWRFGASDYRAALSRGLGMAELGPKPVKAAWDAALDLAMQESGRAVFEEQLIEEMMGELAEVVCHLP